MHVNSGITPEETRLVRAEECIERALALDPECGQAIFVRGIVSGLRGRLEEGVTDVVSAHERTPGDANVLTELSRFLFNAGQPDAHRAVTEALVRVDPLTPISWLNERGLWSLRSSAPYHGFTSICWRIAEPYNVLLQGYNPDHLIPAQQ
jgi:tetratricopeptide (TPR) repeat protein